MRLHGLGFQTVAWYLAAGQPTVRQVSDCLGSGTKIGRAFDPAHRQGERDGDELRFCRLFWQEAGEAECLVRVKIYSVKAIGDVHLHCVHRAKLGVGVSNLVEDAEEGMSKLHRRSWACSNSLLIYPTEREVVDNAGATVALGDDSQGG
jgi:hypothetical protein